MALYEIEFHRSFLVRLEQNWTVTIDTAKLPHGLVLGEDGKPVLDEVDDWYFDEHVCNNGELDDEETELIDNDNLEYEITKMTEVRDPSVYEVKDKDIEAEDARLIRKWDGA